MASHFLDSTEDLLEDRRDLLSVGPFTLLLLFFGLARVFAVAFFSAFAFLVINFLLLVSVLDDVLGIVVEWNTFTCN